MANYTPLVKTVKGMERSHMQIVMIREPFRADFAFALIQKNWSYTLRKWWESLVTILEHWRLEGVVDHVAK